MCLHHASITDDECRLVPVALHREARSLLAERLKGEEVAAFAVQAGGFQQEVPPFARHV